MRRCSAAALPAPSQNSASDSTHYLAELNKGKDSAKIRIVLE